MSENNLEFKCPQCTNTINVECATGCTSKVNCPECATNIIASNNCSSYSLEVRPKRRIRKMRAYL